MGKAEKPDVWFPLMVSSYLKKTMGLNAEQHGAYLMLLISYWVDGPPLDDDSLLAGIARMDSRQWRKTRSIMLRYFYILDGHWRQERADEELERWAERKRRFAERGHAGGIAKAASSTLQAEKSTPKSLLKSYPSSSSREVRAQEGALTLSEGQNDFIGPKEVRDAFCGKLGDAWCRNYLDRCGWQDVPERALIPATRTAGINLVREGRAILSALGLSVLERAA